MAMSLKNTWETGQGGNADKSDTAAENSGNTGFFFS
jgi:hypothetical protein